jgi:BASS family bile acid:Na+ symporter
MNPELLTKILTSVGLIAIMLSMGLKVTFSEAMAAIQKPRFVILGLLVNFLLIPVVTLGLLQWFDPHPMVSVGFLILAVCPGAPVGPPFSAIAKGDVASAIGLMVILSSLSVVLTPLLIQLAFAGLLPAREIHIDSLAIVKTLFIAQLLPLVLGLVLRHRAPKVSNKIARPLGLLANVLLLSVIALVLVREFSTLTLIRLQGWFGMFLLLGASLGLGWICGGPTRAGRKTLALTTASRNAAVGLVIVSSNFAGTPAMSAVVAYSLVSIFGSLGVAFLFGSVPNLPALDATNSPNHTPKSEWHANDSTI